MRRLIKKAQKLQWQSINYEYLDEGFNGQDMPAKNTTCWQEGILFVSCLNGVIGDRGEVRQWQEYNGNKYFGNYPEKMWNEFLENIKQNGVQEKILVFVKKDGTITIAEGNHRVEACKQLGIDTIPAEVRYFGNRQQVEKFTV